MIAEYRVDQGRMLDLLGIEVQLLAAATRDARPDSVVAGASGRTLEDTVRHLGDLYENALSWLGSPGAGTRRQAVPETLPDLTVRFTARAGELLTELGKRPAGEHCPTWWPEDHSVGFWLRRALHATTVHRVDAQTAAGTDPAPIDPDIACDGIDEVLRLWFSYRLHSLGFTASRAWRVAVRAGQRSWLVEADEQRTAARPGEPDGPQEADAVITGCPAAVYLWLWGRLPGRVLDTPGDPDAVAQLWSLLRLATR